MDATNFGIVYAVHIITGQFGSVASKVCECLLRRGPRSLKDISRFAESDINHNKVKNILCLLIQHNCVQAFSVEPLGGSENKATVQYIVLFDNILHGARYNKFSTVVNKELGSQCGAVIDGLLKNGRLTLGQLIERDRGESRYLTYLLRYNATACSYCMIWGLDFAYLILLTRIRRRSRC